MTHQCLVCERINQIKENNNPNFIIELETSYVVLADSQFYYGYVLLLSKYHHKELHELAKEIKESYLKEMAKVAEVIFEICTPNKLNYELLGNKHEHLHWHIIPRYKNDPSPSQPIWTINQEIRNNCPLSEIDKNSLILKIRSALTLSKNV